MGRKRRNKTIVELSDLSKLKPRLAHSPKIELTPKDIEMGMLQKELKDVKQLQPSHHIPILKQPFTAPILTEVEAIEPILHSVCHSLHPEIEPYLSNERVKIARDEEREVAAHIDSLDSRVLQKLNKGRFLLDDTLDLHGFRTEHAQVAVEDFIIRNFVEDKRYLLLIHGRGQGIKEPKKKRLKDLAKEWLSETFLASLLLAFVTAPGRWGGPGALCILLRKRKQPSPKPLIRD